MDPESVSRVGNGFSGTVVVQIVFLKPWTLEVNNASQVLTVRSLEGLVVWVFMINQPSVPLQPHESRSIMSYGLYQ